jgi:hypothetical protein
MLNLFIGWSQQDLETELRRAQEDIAAGKTITQNRSGEVGKVETVEASATARVRQILTALNKLDPATYPADQITPRNRMKAAFSNTIYYGY